MSRYFNTGGPIIPEDNYFIDPLSRVDWHEIQALIDRKRYFVLHAPRQSGKTTLLNAIVKRLNADGKFDALYVNVERAQAARNDFEKGDAMVAARLVDAAENWLPDCWLAREGRQLMSARDPGARVYALLNRWAVCNEKPTVLIVDEIDALIGDTLVTILHELRDGFNERPRKFPQSIMLCGVRDLRDYRIHTTKGEVQTGSGCFNVKARSLVLGNFTEADIRELYGQHTVETGQAFEDAVVPRVMAMTGGQPWLVNALAGELTEYMPQFSDRRTVITVDGLEEAKELLFMRGETHIDDLAGR